MKWSRANVYQWGVSSLKVIFEDVENVFFYRGANFCSLFSREIWKFEEH